MPVNQKNPAKTELVAVSKFINSLSEAGLKVAILQIKHVRGRADMSPGVVGQIASSLRAELPLSEADALRIAHESILETAAFRWANLQPPRSLPTPLAPRGQH